MSFTVLRGNPFLTYTFVGREEVGLVGYWGYVTGSWVAFLQVEWLYWGYIFNRCLIWKCCWLTNVSVFEGEGKEFYHLANVSVQSVLGEHTRQSLSQVSPPPFHSYSWPLKSSVPWSLKGTWDAKSLAKGSHSPVVLVKCVRATSYSRIYKNFDSSFVVYVLRIIKYIGCFAHSKLLFW